MARWLELMSAFGCDLDHKANVEQNTGGRGSSQYNEEKSSAISFNNSSRLYYSGNALKNWIRVDGTYIDFVLDTGAVVSIVTEATA